MKILLFCSLAVALTGCGTTSYTNTTNTPDGVRVEKVNEGAFSRDVEVTTDSQKAYDNCLRQMSPTMGSTQAEMYCRQQTRGGPVGAVAPFGANVIPVNAIGPGMAAPIGPGAYNGMPGAMPVMITPSAAVALERGSGDVVPVFVPDEPKKSKAKKSGGSASNEALIVQELSNQDKRLCELEKSQGKPCKK